MDLDVFSHLTNDHVVALEVMHFELNPVCHVDSWVAAYTSIDLRTAEGAIMRLEVAAGVETLHLMTLPAGLVAASLAGDQKHRRAIEDLLGRLGPVSVRIALCAGIEAMCKCRLAHPEVVELLGESPLTPLRAAFLAPFDLASDHAPLFLAGVVAGIDDPVGGVIEVADLLEASLVELYGHQTALEAVEDHVCRWPTLRYFDADARRVPSNPFGN